MMLWFLIGLPAYFALFVFAGKFIAAGMGSREAEREVVHAVFDRRKA